MDLSGVDASTVVQGNVGTIATSDAFTVKVDNGTAHTITIGAATTMQDLVNEINNADSAITARWNDTDKKIEIEVEAGHSLTLTDSTGTPITQLFGASVEGTEQKFGSAGTDLEELENNYKEVLGQIDSLVKDTGYKGVNLLNGDDLTVYFNEDGSSSLTVSGTTLDSSGLGFTDSSSVDFTQAGSIDNAIAEADAALSKLRSSSASFGTDMSIMQTREDFLTNTVNVLQEGAGKLVNADMNEEAANLLALQTRQQLAISSLTLAAQADQSVLRLF